MRVEAAPTMLESGDEGLPVVAERTGFGSPETMRRAFLRELGVTPAPTGPSSGRPASPATGTARDGDLWPGTVHRVPVSPSAPRGARPYRYVSGSTTTPVRSSSESSTASARASSPGSGG